MKTIESDSAVAPAVAKLQSSFLADCGGVENAFFIFACRMSVRPFVLAGGGPSFFRPARKNALGWNNGFERDRNRHVFGANRYTVVFFNKWVGGNT